VLTVVCTTALLLVISPYNVTPPALRNGTANTILGRLRVMKTVPRQDLNPIENAWNLLRRPVIDTGRGYAAPY
jgi:hypothetical protein